MALSEVAKTLGIHPSTVRLWSDKGVLPVHRTSGGHRRYRRKEIELWIQASREQQVMEPGRALQSAVGQIRMQVAEGRLQAEPWYQKLDEQARMQYRLSGMNMVRGLFSYLASEDHEAESEAYALGYEYASRGRRYALSSIDATQAFLFFRNALLDALVDTYQDARVPSGLAWGKMLKKLHNFTDQILVTLLKTYQTFEEAEHEREISQ